MAKTNTTDKKETFFPGTRRKILLEKIQPLANAEGYRRIKLNLVMPLSDGKVIGIPEWLEQPIKLVMKADAGQEKTVSVVELDGVNIHAFATDTSETADIDLTATVLCNFVVRRATKDTPSGNLAEAELAMVAYCAWDQRIWDWGFVTYDRSFFATFGSTQARISFGKPAKEAKEEEVEASIEFPVDAANLEQQPGESYEDARKRATRAEFDDAFGGTGTTGDTAPKDAAVVADKKVRTMTLKGPKAVN
jgi:hypothetical protein